MKMQSLNSVKFWLDHSYKQQKIVPNEITELSVIFYKNILRQKSRPDMLQNFISKLNEKQYFDKFTSIFFKYNLINEKNF